MSLMVNNANSWNNMKPFLIKMSKNMSVSIIDYLYPEATSILLNYSVVIRLTVSICIYVVNSYLFCKILLQVSSPKWVIQHRKLGWNVAIEYVFLVRWHTKYITYITSISPYNNHSIKRTLVYSYKTKILFFAIKK